MTIQEKLTAEFSELDRVTPRPLTHEDYAIAAIQFLQIVQFVPLTTDQKYWFDLFKSKPMPKYEWRKDLESQLTDDDRATIHGIVLQTTQDPGEAYFMTISAEFAILHERARNAYEIEKLKVDRLRLLSDKGEQMSNYEDLLRENALVSADRDAWKDRYGKLVVEAKHADEDEIKGLRYRVNELECERDRALVRANKVEEWLTEYRDELKKENAFHKNTGIINAINELLNGIAD